MDKGEPPEGLCKEAKKTPQRSYRGPFDVRVFSEVHEKAAAMAEKMGVWPEESLINTDFPAAHGWAVIFRTDKSLKM